MDNLNIDQNQNNNTAEINNNNNNNIENNNNNNNNNTTENNNNNVNNNVNNNISNNNLNKLNNYLNESENSIGSPLSINSSIESSDIAFSTDRLRTSTKPSYKNVDEELGSDYEKEIKMKEFDIKDFDQKDVEEDKDLGFKGLKTFKIMAERYVFGIIVAAVVGTFIVLLSLPKWSDEKTYLNNKAYSIFFIIGSLFFGPIYVVTQFIVSYGLKKVKDAKLIIYGSLIIIAFIILFVVFTIRNVNFWFYYLDVISVVILFSVGEVCFSFRLSSTLQKVERGIVSKLKSAMTAYNYAAPDIIVTVFSLVYMFFLIPVYLSITNNILRLGWRLIIHPIYWTIIVMIARQFLDRDISTDDIMLNTNIVLHTFFHHQTLGKVFVFTLDGSGDTQLTYIGICISAIEDILLRSIALKRDEWFLTFLYGKQRAVQQVYSQESLQLRAAILNIQVALDFSGLITAPLFVFMFEKHKTVFHILDGSPVVPLTLFIQSLVSILLDFIVEIICTYIETKYYRLPIKNTWKWMKSHKFSFMSWLVYGSVTMGLTAQIWLMVMVPRAGFCKTENICTCGSILSNSIPEWCFNSTSSM